VVVVVARVRGGAWRCGRVFIFMRG